MQPALLPAKVISAAQAFIDSNRPPGCWQPNGSAFSFAVVRRLTVSTERKDFQHQTLATMSSAPAEMTPAEMTATEMTAEVTATEMVETVEAVEAIAKEEAIGI
jgi:hypothetical protein